MKVALLCFYIAMAGCINGKKSNTILPVGDTVKNFSPDSTLKIIQEEKASTTANITTITNKAATMDSLPGLIVAFAKTLIGIPYKYASSNAAVGLDCSGFITNVFNHFNISVPRSSVDFTDYGKTIDSVDAKPGDLILFTGTDSSIKVVGHMGIVVHNKNGAIDFIHSTSGKAYSVTVTSMNSYYKGRFVKVIRIF